MRPKACTFDWAGMETSVRKTRRHGRGRASAPRRAGPARRQSLEQRLRDAEERLRDIMEISSDWVWETDADHRFTHLSGRFFEVTGIAPETLIGTNRDALIHATLNPDDRQRHLAEIQAHLPFRDFIYQVRTAKGLRYFRTSGKPRFDADGRFIGYRGIGADVTEAIEANRRAEAEHRYFIEAIEAIPASLMLHDADDRLVICNTITRRFYPGLDHLLVPGTPFETLLRAQAARGFIPDAVGRLEEWIAERMQAHRNAQGTITRHLADGRWIQIIERRTSDGGVIGIRVDVTELKKQEQALARQTAFLQAVLDNISQGLSVVDGDMKLAAFNRRFLEMFDFPESFGEVGRPFEDFIRCIAERGEYGSGDVEEQVRRRVALARDPNPYCVEHVRPDGTVIEIRGNPMPAGGFVMTYTDITEHKRITRALKENAQQLAEYARDLQRSNTELEQFAYIASHDLQEPLRMVSSYCQLLQRRYRGRLDQDADEFIGYAVEGATRMQKMINDLLTYSRVGRTGGGGEAVACDEVVRTAVANLRIAIEESGARVTWRDLPTVVGDRTQLVQLFQNLIGNAIKFRSERPLEIDIWARRDGAFWEFAVSDNGIGIEPQYAERIFLIFQRLHDRSRYPGTGIGLAICRKVVERHGGRIWVTSEPGKGTTFHFTLSADAARRKE